MFPIASQTATALPSSLKGPAKYGLPYAVYSLAHEPGRITDPAKALLESTPTVIVIVAHSTKSKIIIRNLEFSIIEIEFK